MIHAHNLGRRSVGRQLARIIRMIVPPNASASAYIVASTASSAMTLGTALTLVAALVTNGGMLLAPHSVTFTPGGAPTTPFTFTIVGENQFGDTVTESVNVPTATVVHSSYAYRRIISITPTAKSSTGTDAVSIGWATAIVATGPRIAFPCKFKAASSVKQISQLVLASQPTFTVQGDPYWTLTMGTNAPASNPWGEILAILDEKGDPFI